MAKTPDKKAKEPKLGESTLAVRGGLDRSPHGETAEALYLNSGFVYPDGETAQDRFAGRQDGYVYARYGNPTVTMFENRLRLMEGAEACYAVASGMAAVFGALACQVRAGDHVVASRALFGSCYQVITNILARFGVSHTLVDGSDLEQWRAAFKPETKLAFIETPSNPALEIIDMAAVADITHEHGARLVVDNIFATPVLQKPFEMGADVVVYSGTKHIDGQGRVLGGAVLSSADFKEDELKPFLRHTGPSLAPFNAWVLLKGLETLKLRVMHQSASALKIAESLANLPGVVEVRHPFLKTHPQNQLARRQMRAGGTMVTFTLEGGTQQAFALLKKLKVIDISNNLGDAKSLITHPATTTHRNIGAKARADAGIVDGMLRLSVGLEDVEDLIEDLTRALGA